MFNRLYERLWVMQQSGVHKTILVAFVGVSTRKAGFGVCKSDVLARVAGTDKSAIGPFPCWAIISSKEGSASKFWRGSLALSSFGLRTMCVPPAILIAFAGGLRFAVCEHKS